MSAKVEVTIQDNSEFMEASLKDNQETVNVGVSELGPRGPKGEPGYMASPFLSLKRLAGYLYEMTFDKLPDYLNQNKISAFGCTSYVKDGKLYRNLDWNYGKTAEFKLLFKDVEGMGFIDGLNDGELEGKADILGQLPYRICDGCNISGIMVSTHVLFNDFNFKGTGSKSAPITLLPFKVLTTMTNVNTLSPEVNELLNNIKVSEGADLLIQVLVTNGVTTKLFTPKSDGSGYEYIDISSNPKVTNFKWVNRKIVQRTDSDIQKRPTGIERWNQLEDENISLEKLRFTLAYESSNRLSEFIGVNGTTKESSDADLMNIYNKAHEKYLKRTRNNELWQTVHSVIYSSNGFEKLNIQENYRRNY